MGIASGLLEEAGSLRDLRTRKKIFSVPLSKEINRNEKGNVLVLGKFTSDNKDDWGDIITKGATERAIPKYRQWGNIRYMHLPRPVGKVSRIGTDDGLDWNEVEIEVIDPQAAFEVEAGLLQALSIGALIDIDSLEFDDDGGWIINDYILGEISLVDHPANYDATLDLSVGLPSQVRELAREYGTVVALKSISSGRLPIIKASSEPESSVEESIEEEISVTANIEQADPELDITVEEDSELDVTIEEEAELEDEVIEDEVIEDEESDKTEEEMIEEVTTEEEESDSVVDEEAQTSVEENMLDLIESLSEEELEVLTQMLISTDESGSEAIEAETTAELDVVPEEEVSEESSDEVDEVTLLSEITALKEEVVSLKSELTDLKKIGMRKGSAPEVSELGEPEAEEETPRVPEVRSLKDAVRQYARSSNRYTS
jgi:hypothetical protein